MRFKSIIFGAALCPLTGCLGVLDPHGPVGVAQRLILFNSIGIMLVIVVPVILGTLVCVWWFRAGNARASYRPDWTYSGHLELLVWAVPAMVIMFLGGIAWSGSHALDPYLPLKGKAVEVQVVSLNWKWLFIYPKEQIATVNQLVVPTGIPVHFSLTSSGVMNSFFVPQLGSQIYTMAGMVSQVSLQADDTGQYAGLSAMFSGAGFPDMNFAVRAVAQPDYDAWVAQAKAGGQGLDGASYANLSKLGTAAPAIYSSVETGMFDRIVTQTVTSR